MDLDPEVAQELKRIIAETKRRRAKQNPKIRRRRVMSLPKGSPERYEGLLKLEFDELMDETNVELRDNSDGEGGHVVGPKEDLKKWTKFFERWMPEG